MKRTTTKNTIAKEIFYHMGIPVAIAEKVVDSFFETIIEECLKDGEVKIANFASFKVKDKKARLGRNLNNFESVMIPSRKVISFTPSENLKREVNEN